MLERLTLATRRAPKSLRFWTPESTIAIAGALPRNAVRSPGQRFAFPDSYGQSWCVEVAVPETFTVESGVTIRPGTALSRATHFAGSDKLTAPTSFRFCRLPLAPCSLVPLLSLESHFNAFVGAFDPTRALHDHVDERVRVVGRLVEQRLRDPALAVG